MAFFSSKGNASFFLQSSAGVTKISGFHLPSPPRPFNIQNFLNTFLGDVARPCVVALIFHNQQDLGLMISLESLFFILILSFLSPINLALEKLGLQWTLRNPLSFVTLWQESDGVLLPSNGKRANCSGKRHTFKGGFSRGFLIHSVKNDDTAVAILKSVFSCGKGDLQPNTAIETGPPDDGWIMSFRILNCVFMNMLVTDH